MTIANYGELKTAVREWYSDRSDIPTTVYDLATAELNSKLRLKIMESTTSLAVSGESTALPSDFLEVRHAYLDRDPRIVLDAVDEFSKTADYDSSGVPRSYTIIDGNILLNPSPDGSYTVFIRYIASLSDLSADADTNTVLTTYPAMFMYAALKHTAVWAQDAEMMPVYSQALEAEVKRVKRVDQASRFGAGPLRVRSESTP